MLSYQFDNNIMVLKETKDGSDFEFHIQVLTEKPYVERIRQVWHFFDQNKDYTDVLFYAYPNHEYRVIVRQEHYVDFLTELFKAQLLLRLEWNNI